MRMPALDDLYRLLMYISTGVSDSTVTAFASGRIDRAHPVDGLDQPRDFQLGVGIVGAHQHIAVDG